jgi:hypothetical protein
MENLSELIHFVQDVEKAFSWQIKANGGHVENAETDTIKLVLSQKEV